MTILNETDEHFYVDNSTLPGAGKGLFAKQPLRKGDKLAVIGVLVPVNSVSDVCTYYTDAYKFRVGDHLLIPVGYGAMVNHSVSPNLEKVVDGGQVYLQALQSVPAGEELFFTYDAYAQERFGLR